MQNAVGCDKKQKNSEAELQGLVYFGRITDCTLIIIRSNNNFQHRSQWGICKLQDDCAQLVNAKSEQAKILDLSVLCGH